MNDKKTKPAVPQFSLPEWLRPHLAEVRAWGPVSGEDSTCWVEGCERSPHLHGLCRRHYFRARRVWKPSADEQLTVGAASDEETDPRRAEA